MTAATVTLANPTTPTKKETMQPPRVSKNHVQQQTVCSHTQVIDNNEVANPDEASTAVTDLSTETTSTSDHVNMDRAQHVEGPDIRPTIATDVASCANMFMTSVSAKLFRS
ncbi:hypothetical protein PF005_g24180 [Phytophthora fragariae]|uniref:Uncharacterized protein n=1 Tax=Phytophthora fragariae TaxID=53985 RepID=A0A6A3SJN2_9STRA|nr:hypothetical protein PF003_g40620 [Phytophthora fragariae]KAE8924798.1 hypothetical protein PF009_g24976 [Phytophthora fragariae]KAE8978387.1 hypothetical protein PF011_g23262 [Phytophthora fragariae]KAE9063243.1 hypothetical protein PF010_g29078 [Phytophthora fragariae]KAE9088851.1 hypothetical protein PF007_g19823 [Phytophthora fragariae]